MTGSASLPPAHADVVVVGAGFAAIALTHALKSAGVTDFLVLERESRIGGTWRDNTYPGCRCDIESILYAFSFAPNPDWTQTYAAQPEILAYLERAGTEVGLDDHLFRDCGMTSARWDAGSGTWHLTTTRGQLTARVLVTATGPFNEPDLLELPGQDTYPGTIVHTARWPAGLDLADRRVAVVGTGASAVQVVPAIQPEVRHLTVVQRTPAWVLPRANPAIEPGMRDRLRHDPELLRRRRQFVYGAHEVVGLALRRQDWLLRLGESAARRHLARQVPDPELRRVLTPRYRMGCKRVTPSDDYYPALTRPNVDLVPHAATAFSRTGIVTADGRHHPADVVIMATGFVMATPSGTRAIAGSGGRTLYEAFTPHPQGYLGTTVHGFPNLFTVPGPATGQGHTSVLLYYEAQAAYVAQAVAWMRGRGIQSIDVDPDVQQRFNADVQRRLRRSVWAGGGCHSWYQDPSGQVSLVWPSSTGAFVRRLRTFDPDVYTLRRR